jgi:DNA topoisomerase-3
MIPRRFETRVISNTSKQFSNVKAFMKSSEVSELIIATDAGREGELVARWIIEKVGFNKPMKRLWISSMTDSAIKAGFRNIDIPVKINPYERKPAA